MRYEHEKEKTRRHAENTIAEANRHLESGKIRNPQHHQMLTAMIKDATDTIKNLNDMDDRRPYSDTNIGVRTNARRHDKNTDDVMRIAMETINKILPHITTDDHYDDDRYNMDDGRYDDEMDDSEIVNMPRWRSARTGRFLPNLYGPSRVRRVRRRAEMDDMNNRYNDDRYDDDTQRTADETRRMANEARRAADEARRAADEVRHTADDTYNTSPAMKADRARYDDTRSDRTDRRYDRADDDAHRPGPDMRR